MSFTFVRISNPGDAAARANRPAELRRIKQEDTDFFSQWRIGRFWEYSRGLRRDRIARIVHPKPGAWPGHIDPDARATWPPLAITRVPNYARPGGGDTAGSRRQVDAVVQRAGEALRPAGFRLKRRLGYGGLGVAALFEMQDARTWRRVSVVVKADLSRARVDRVRRERDNMIAMAGAEHVIQRVVLQALPTPTIVPASGGQNNSSNNITQQAVSLGLAAAGAGLRAGLGLLRRTLNNNQLPSTSPAGGGAGNGDDSWTLVNSASTVRRRLDDRNDLIMMQYAEHGALDQWISKMNDMPGNQQDFSDKVLWLMFECLYRGCVAMAYPRAFHQSLDPARQQVPAVRETIPQGQQAVISNPLVHLDLDPLNIFVSSLDGNNTTTTTGPTPHATVPRLVIADLGLSEMPASRAHADDLDEELYLWRLRSAGKRDHLLPEQTSEEWDYLPDLAALRAHAVCGSYSSASNVFHAGLAMWELITLCHPEVPMVARAYDCATGPDGGGGVRTGWTYGYWLLDRYRTGGWGGGPARELREAVAWCMDYDPTRRPTLAQLGTVIEAQVARVWSETDADTRRWAQRFFTPPPPMRA